MLKHSKIQSLNISQIHKAIISIYQNDFKLKKITKTIHIVFWWNTQAISYIKKEKNGVKIGFHKGYLLSKDFNFIQTCSKYIRHLYFEKFEKKDSDLLQEIIQQSINCSIEIEEKKELKKQLKGLK